MTAATQEWVFFGRVTPERAPLSLGELGYALEEYVVEFQLKYRVHQVTIVDSQVIARVTVLEGDTDIFTLRNLLASHLRGLSDLVSFLSGSHFEVELISAASATHADTWQIFGNQIPALARRAELTPENLRIALTDSSLLLAVADFRKSMPDPTETGFYCYRAIEAVMQSFAQDGDTEQERWMRMRDALNIDREALLFIKKHADGRRHGKPAPSISDEQRRKVYLITWAVIERLLLLKKSGGSRLSVGDHPQITEHSY